MHPAAFDLSRKLGRRFRDEGWEVSVLVGSLALHGDTRQVRIRRVQDDSGESVEVASGGRGSLTWDAGRGATSSGRAASGEERTIAERIALDSPDQFVLAQLRGASYFVVARNLRADEEGGADGYDGLLYDVVRVSEPRRQGGGGPLNTWRLYYLDSKTGLPNRIVYEERGDRVETSFEGWAEHAGELLPTRVTWRRAGQVVMELIVTNATHGPRQ